MSIVGIGGFGLSFALAGVGLVSDVGAVGLALLGLGGVVVRAGGGRCGELIRARRPSSGGSVLYREDLCAHAVLLDKVDPVVLRRGRATGGVV